MATTRRLKVKLTEMQDADVHWISVVERAASRIPFRVFKADKEQGMIDLSNPLRALKGEKAPKAPEQVQKADVVAVVTMDHGDEVAEKLKSVLSANGVEVSAVQKNEDGTMTYLTGDSKLEGTVLVKLSDHSLVAVKGLECYGDDLKLSEAAAGRSFMPGVYTATETLGSMISSMVYGVKDQQELATKVEALLQDFSKHVLGLARALPAAVFKMDTDVQATLRSVAEEKAKKAEEAKAAEEAKKSETPEATPATVDEPANAAIPDTSPVDEGAAAPAVKAEADAEMVALLKTMQESLDSMAHKMEEVHTRLETVAQAQEATEQKVADIAQKADTATHAVKNTILAPAPAGDAPGKAVVQKQEDTDPRTGAFDTAFTTRRSNRSY